MALPPDPEVDASDDGGAEAIERAASRSAFFDPADAREAVHSVEIVISQLEDVVNLLRSHSEAGLLGHVQDVLGESIDLLKALPTQEERAGQTPDAMQSGGLAGFQVGIVSRFICDHLHDKISIRDLATAVNLSDRHFKRAFQKSFGLAPMRYVRRTRICRARRLLEETPLPLIEIAERCGFSDQAQFTRTFQLETGTTPRRWRRQHQTAQWS